MALLDCRLCACMRNAGGLSNPRLSSQRSVPSVLSPHAAIVSTSAAPLDSLVSFCSISPLPRGKNVSRSRRRLPVPGAQASDTFVPYEDRDYPNMEDTETEDEARRRNWIERGWAPWEEILSPEAQFALESIKEGVEFPEVSKEAHENLIPKIWAEKQRKLEEEAERKAEEEEKQVTPIEGSIYDQDLVFTLIPPRDWPPAGWQVDPDELAFIREAHALSAVPVTLDDVKKNLEPKGAEIANPRWEMFLRQYADWFAANKERLDIQSLEIDPEYYPGGRRTGEDYIGDWMYELPFIYPGQHWWGEVSSVNLYEGAFVCIGCVHDVWVPIRDNDWYHVRNYVKVGMRVQVEILAKRDPYRYRFPIEGRLVDPNIDSLIFKRFKHPPITIRPGDISIDDLSREARRPFWPERRPEEEDAEDEPNVLVHPYVAKLWQIHVSEQMILDHEEQQEMSTDDDTEDDSEDESEEEAEEGAEDWLGEGWDVVRVGPESMDMRGPNGETEWMDYGDGEDSIPTLKLVTESSEMDLDAARAERKELYELQDRLGDNFVMPKLRREKRMDELDAMHNQRFQEETEALLRDETCRLEQGLPLEEPGRYASPDAFGKNPYDPRDRAWRADSWFSVPPTKDDPKRDRQPRAARVEDVAVEEDEHDEEAWHREVKDVEIEEDSDGEEPDDGIKLGKGGDRGRTKGLGAVNGIATLRLEDFGIEGDWKVEEEDDTTPEDGDDVIDV